jgi:hypothetical protein
MRTVKKPTVSLFVDRTTQRWVVRDPDGQFWTVPPGEHAWERRELLEATPELDLEPIPGHYRYLFTLPF